MLHWFWPCHNPPPPPSAQVRKLCELGEAGAEARLVLLDIPDDGGYYLSEPGAPVDAPAVRAFLAAYTAKGLTRRQLKK
jgi:hypothetical protein